MLQKMGGLFKRMPVTGTACSIGALSISGVPPLNGFWSKLIIIIAAVRAGHPILAAMAVIVSLLTLLMFIKVQRYSIFGELPEALEKVKEAPVLMCVSMVVLAALCVSVGLLYPVLKPWLLGPAQDMLLKSQDYINFVLWG
jgi:multicomponent Na+:H+ antiporter subunit D